MISNRDHQNMTDKFINTQVVNRGLDERTAKAYRLDLEKFYLWLESGEEDRKATEGAIGGAAGEAMGETAAGVMKETAGELIEEAAKGMMKEAAEGSMGETAEKIIGIAAKEFKPAGQMNQKPGKQDQKNGVVSVPEKMEDYLNYLSREKGLRQSTICRKQRVLGYYLAYLKSQGILEQYHPLKPVSKMKEEPADMLLTKKEVEALFRAIDREYEKLDSDFRRRVCLRDQVMMKLLFYHGIEVSELLRLEVTDYNRKTAFLTIRGKRGKSRSVYLFSRELRGQMEQWIGEHEYFEHEEMYQERLFLSKMGKPLSMKMVINIFDKYRVMAGIEKECKPKDLKNSLGRYAEELVWELG